MNFAISSTGRTGTHFLARQLNRSEKWTVKQEVYREKNNENFRDGLYFQQGKPIHKETLKAFEQDYYGEVSFQLYGYLPELNVRKKAIIIRNPRDVCLSLANRKCSNKWFTQTNTVYNYLVDYANKNKEVMVIDFKKMVSDMDYFKKIAFFVGIDDLDFSKINLSKKTNIYKHGYIYNTWDDLPKENRDFYNTLKWKKYEKNILFSLQAE